MTPVPISTDNAEGVLYADTARLEGRPTGAIGRFRCEDATGGAQLLRQAAGMARDLGLEALVGPMDGDTWHGYRLRSWSDGTPDFLLEPVSGPRDLEAFRQAGFTEISRYLSTKGALEDALAVRHVTSSRLEVESWDGQDMAGLCDEIFDLALAAFSRNAFYSPIARTEFRDLYLRLEPLLDPDLVFLARDRTGALAGFLFGLPDTGSDTARVILKTYASRIYGGGHMLADAFHRRALEKGYRDVIHALMAEDNLSRKRSATHATRPFRRYALMGKHLDD